MDRSRRPARRDARRAPAREAAIGARPAGRAGSIDPAPPRAKDRPRPGPVDPGRDLLAAGVPAAGAAPPAASRLTLRRARNRRRPGSVWSRLPRPGAIADACGRALRRSLPAAAAVAALVAVGGAVWWGYRWLTRSPRFAITQIVVHGTHRVDPDRLRARLPIHAGDSVFTDLTGVAAAVRESPWIAAAEVRRILPHTIVIDVREHVAAAVVELGERYLVDAAGRPFKRAGRQAGGLPIITGISRAAFTADPAAAAATVQGALAAAARWRAADRPAIGELHVDPHGAVTLHTRDPAIAVRLGALGPELAGRIHRFDTAWAGLSEAERAHARAIHLDARPDHVTVAFATD